MADQYEKRKMFQGPGLFIFLIPVGTLLIFILFDIGYKFYNDYKIGKDTEEVLTLLMDREGLDTYEKMKEFAITQYERLGYTDLEDMSLIIRDDYIILVNYKSYFSMVGMFTGQPEKLAEAHYKGYYNEYKETVVEKHDPTYEEELELLEDEETKEKEE